MTQETARATDTAGAGTQAPDADAQAGGVGSQAPTDSSGAPPDQQSTTDTRLRQMEGDMRRLQQTIATQQGQLQQQAQAFSGEVERRVTQAVATRDRKDEEKSFADAMQKAREGDTAALDDVDRLARSWYERPNRQQQDSEAAQASYNEGLMAAYNLRISRLGATPEQTRHYAELWQSGQLQVLDKELDDLAAQKTGESADPTALKAETERLQTELDATTEDHKIADARKEGPETGVTGAATGGGNKRYTPADLKKMTREQIMALPEEARDQAMTGSR